jgi:hypothetical protein
MVAMERNWLDQDTDDEPGADALSIRPLYELPDYARGPSAESDPWQNIAETSKSAPRPEPGAAAQALAETYERYADQLAAIEALRSGPDGAQSAS